MTNIWGFLLYTLSASLTAAMLLAVKLLLRGRLSPRWQYYVWGVLACRLVLPVGLAAAWVRLFAETLKSFCGQSGASAWEPIRFSPPIPFITGLPGSLADWIFILYICGIFVFLIHWAVSSRRLRRGLMDGSEISLENRAALEAVCQKYGLRACRAVEVNGLQSAALRGVFRPVLALPAGETAEEQELLRELLRLRYHDAAQSAVWRFFRALNWCNPFMFWIFARIDRDMESLRGQRALELAEGEKPRRPALVSVCTLVILAASLFATGAASIDGGSGGAQSNWAFARCMASARVTRCGTVAGALDTYLKGLVQKNGFYLAAATAFEDHAALVSEMQASADAGRNAGYVDRLIGLGGDKWDEVIVAPEYGCSIRNLREQDDGSCTALVSLRIASLRRAGANGNPEVYSPELRSDIPALLVLPLRVYEEDGWVVEAGESFIVLPSEQTMGSRDYRGYSSEPPVSVYRAESEFGEYTVNIGTNAIINFQEIPSMNYSFFGDESDNIAITEPIPDAKFREIGVNFTAELTLYGDGKAHSDVFVSCVPLASLDEEVDFEKIFEEHYQKGNYSGSGSDGLLFEGRPLENELGDVTISSGGGTSRSFEDYESLSHPAGFAASIYLDGALVETVILTEVTE